MKTPRSSRFPAAYMRSRTVHRSVTGRTPDFLRLARGPAGFHHKVRWVMVMAFAIALLALVPPLSSARTGPGDTAGANGTGSVPVHAPTAAPCSRDTTCAAGPLVRSDLSRMTSAGFLANRTMGWSEVTSPPPTLGVGSGMIADTSTGTALLFGGESSGRLVNTTFAYTEATDGWTTIPTTNAPGPRSDFALAFDPIDSTGILFGGLTNLTSLAVSNETWSYDVTTAQWTSQTLGPAPPAREAAAFAISPSLGVAFLYGGWNRNYTGTESITYSDLWELNLTTFAWTEVTVPGLRPSPLEDAAMLWDPTTARLEMFGGCYPCTSAVWQFNPTALSWTDLGTPSGGPAARAGASWAYDPTDQEDLLFGGANGGVSYNDTYVFDAVSDTWVAQTLAPRPAARADAASGFLDVPGNETWLLEGGVAGSVTYSDLWRLSATANVSVQVLNATSLRPLAGAKVNLSGRTAGFTNVSGNLTLTQVNAVNQPFDVSEFRFFTRNATIWLAPGRTTNLTVDLTTEPPGSVFVTVFQPSGTPFVNASVNLTVNGTRINLVPALTNGTGNASFFGVPPGRVNVTVSAPFERPNYQAGVLVASGYFNATIGSGSRPGHFRDGARPLPGGPPRPPRPRLRSSRWEPDRVHRFSGGTERRHARLWSYRHRSRGDGVSSRVYARRLPVDWVGRDHAHLGFVAVRNDRGERRHARHGPCDPGRVRDCVLHLSPPGRTVRHEQLHEPVRHDDHGAPSGELLGVGVGRGVPPFERDLGLRPGRLAQLGHLQPRADPTRDRSRLRAQQRDGETDPGSERLLR